MEKGINKNPILRFPEFKNEWKHKLGNEIFEPVSNKNHNSKLPILAITQEYGAIPRDKINYKVSVTDESIGAYKVVEVGDFIISLRSFQGGIEYSKYKGICSPAYIILRPTIKVDRLFFKYYFKTTKFIQAMNTKLEGIRDGKMVSYKYFSEIQLPLPDISEQERISKFFVTLDKKISELKSKKLLLEDYKNEVSKKIFSRRLKFKNLNRKEFPKWEKKRLEEVAQINPKPISLPKTFIYIDLESVVRGQLLKEERIELRNAPSRAQRSLKKYDILFQTVRPYQKNNYLFLSSKKDYVASTGYAQLRTKMNPFFLYQLLHEQNKIAEFLGAIDKRIVAVSIQIEQSEQYRKGLLQRMFC